jgi:predicted porin
MQKKILVAAVAGALASPLALAQSSVTIYGTFDLSVANSRYSSSPTTNSVSKMDVYSQSSRLGFRGEENLGGGLRAWFQAENGIYADGRTNNPLAGAFGSRNTGIGLTGGWGTVMTGMWDSPYKVSLGGITGMAVVGGLPGHNGPAMGNGDTTGTNPNANCENITNVPTTTIAALPTTVGGTPICGQGEMGATQFHRRLSNVVQYWSPKFGGFDFRVAMTANEEKATNTTTVNNNPRLWAVNGTYAAGPWYATIAYEHHKDYRSTAAVRSTKDKGWVIGGGYNFGAAALNVGYERLKYGNTGAAGAETGFTRPSWFVGVSVPMGPAGSAFRAGYSRMSGNKSCGAAAACGSTTGLRVFTLGYGYALSKRSTAYVQYGKVTNSAASAQVFNTSPNGPNGVSSAIGAGADQTWLGVGMVHTF